MKGPPWEPRKHWDPCGSSQIWLLLSCIACWGKAQGCSGSQMFGILASLIHFGIGGVLVSQQYQPQDLKGS